MVNTVNNKFIGFCIEALNCVYFRNDKLGMNWAPVQTTLCFLEAQLTR